MIITALPLQGREVVGTSVELAHDNSWAKLGIYVEGGKPVEITGMPRKLREIGRHIVEGLRRPKRA